MSEARVEEQISREILDVHVDSYGVGVERMVTHVLPDLVVIVMDVELTPSEATLVGAGEHEAVKHTRESFQRAIEPRFRAVVERATGRRVVSFLSHMMVEEPPYAVEVFRLSPSSV